MSNIPKWVEVHYTDVSEVASALDSEFGTTAANLYINEALKQLAIQHAQYLNATRKEHHARYDWAIGELVNT